MGWIAFFLALFLNQALVNTKDLTSGAYGSICIVALAFGVIFIGMAEEARNARNSFFREYFNLDFLDFCGLFSFFVFFWGALRVVFKFVAGFLMS